MIATTTSSLDNVLYPLKAQLEESIARDRALDAQTVADMEAAVAERAATKHAHEVFVEEGEAAIEAVDECLALLSSLDSGSTSLI